MEIIDCVQGEDGWFEARLGSIGGSQITTAVSKGSGRGKLIYKKAAEILSQTHEEGPKLRQFDRGHLYEPAARKFYAMTYKIKPIIVGLVRHDEYKHFSPDLLINDDGYGEIKVREPSVFLERCDTREISTADRRQVHWGFRIMKRSYCDYIQYCPEYEDSDIPPIFVMRIYPDEKEIRFLDDKCNGFIGELKNYVRKKREAA